MATKEKKIGKFYNFRGMSHMNADARFPMDKSARAVPQDSLISTLFAPDPKTGMPNSSALLVVQNGSFDPATKEMLRRRYCSPIPSDSVGSANVDDVVKYTKTRRESLDEYVSRLTNDIETYYKKPEK